MLSSVAARVYTAAFTEQTEAAASRTTLYAQTEREHTTPAIVRSSISIDGQRLLVNSCCTRVGWLERRRRRRHRCSENSMAWY